MKDVNKPVTASNIVEYRFTRLPFGIICSPFLLSAVVNKHLESQGTPEAASLIGNTYVDNILMHAKSTEEARELCIKVKKVFAEAKMQLREFLSNDMTINVEFADDDQFEFGKFLGYSWNTKKDILSIESKRKDEEPDRSKRGVLSKVATGFDPLGFVEPLKLKGKLLYQQLCREGTDWDEPLSDEHAKEFEEIGKELGSMSVQVPRRPLPETNEL